jgi:CTP:molybdopterin cytidylyltransferase MocA
VNKITAIILAAGASQRMGTPKALLKYQAETFVGRLTRVFAAACDDVIVVLGNHVEEIRPHVPMRAKVVVNPEPRRGQLSSLRTALIELPADADGFAFIPVDCPAVAEETVVQLARMFAERERSTRFVIPRTGEKRGHPVFGDRGIADELLALPATGEARTVVHAHVPNTKYLDVTDRGIFADIDTPEAYQRLLSESRP